MRDSEDLSTPELIRRITAAMDRPARLFPFPAGLLRLAGRVTGNAATVNRVLGSLQVDDGKIRRHLGWTPSVDVVQGLQETVAWFTSRTGPRDDADITR